MAENWGGKLIAFLIIFFLFWILGGVVMGDAKIGFLLGIVVAGIFVGVSIPIGNKNR